MFYTKLIFNPTVSDHSHNYIFGNKIVYIRNNPDFSFYAKVKVFD